MKKVLLFLSIIILISSCDPLSISRIYMLNSTNHNLIIKIKTALDGAIKKEIKSGEIILFYDAKAMGNEAIEPSKSIISIEILDEDQNVLKSITSKPQLFKLFNEEKLAMGSEENSYLFLINNNMLIE